MPNGLSRSLVHESPSDITIGVKESAGILAPCCISSRSVGFGGRFNRPDQFLDGSVVIVV